MNKLALAKTAINLVAGAGVGKIVKDVIAHHSSPESTYDKVVLYAGSAVIAMAAKDASKSYVNAKIDETVELRKRMQDKIEENQKATETE